MVTIEKLQEKITTLEEKYNQLIEILNNAEIKSVVSFDHLEINDEYEFTEENEPTEENILI